MIIISFIIYITFILVIGFFAYRQTKSAADFFLGGRHLNKWVAALSAGASDMSQWLLMGLPGYAFVSGFEVGWLLFGLIVGTYCNWRLLAGRLRLYSELLDNALTLPSYFSRRFADPTILIRVISAVFILIFFTVYISSGFVAGAKLFHATFDIPYHYALVIGAIIILVYTLFGGFLAVCWTDVIQAILMAIAIAVVPVMALLDMDDIGSRLDMLQKNSPAVFNPFTNNKGDALTFIAVISLLAWGLGYFGQPHILARFKAIDSVESIPAARRIAVSWTVLTLCSGALCGLLGLLYFQPGVVADEEKVFLLLVETLLHPLIAGFFLAAILAAIMSTTDSQLLVFSAALSEDLVKWVWCKSLNHQQHIWIGRIGVAIIAIAAMVIALDPTSKVLKLVGFAWAGLGASFGPVLIMSLYWQRMNWQGAVAGITVGGLTVLCWKLWGDPAVYELLPGFFVSLLSILVVTAITPQPSRQIGQDFRKLVALHGRSS